MPLVCETASVRTRSQIGGGGGCRSRRPSNGPPIRGRSEAGYAGANMLVRPQMHGWPVAAPIAHVLALQIRRGGVPDACEMTASSPWSSVLGARLD